MELFEYDGEDKKAPQKRSSEVGGSHICFEVEDVFASAERLTAMGVEMLEGPTTVEANSATRKTRPTASGGRHDDDGRLAWFATLSGVNACGAPGLRDET